MQRIILASGSKRRQEILEKLGVEFEVAESGYDESKIVTDDPVELVEELAIQKAMSVANQYNDALIIGGDTVVYVAGEVLGKPTDKRDAERMLKLLFGTTHMVVTGVAVVNSLTGDQVVGHEEGWVRFRQPSPEEFKQYLAPFVTEQTGSLSAIIGFPITLVSDLLEQMGAYVEVSPEELEISIRNDKIGIEGQ